MKKSDKNSGLMRGTYAHGADEKAVESKRDLGAWGTGIDQF